MQAISCLHHPQHRTPKYLCSSANRYALLLSCAFSHSVSISSFSYPSFSWALQSPTGLKCGGFGYVLYASCSLCQSIVPECLQILCISHKLLLQCLSPIVQSFYRAFQPFFLSLEFLPFLHISVLFDKSF